MTFKVKLLDNIRIYDGTQSSYLKEESNEFINFKKINDDFCCYDRSNTNNWVFCT